MPRDRDFAAAVFSFPATGAGRLSVGLAGAFAILFAAWLFYVTSVEMSRPTFFSDPLHAVLLLGAAAAGICGAFSGVVAVAARRERSILAVLAVLLGAFVLYWAIAEIGGH